MSLAKACSTLAKFEADGLKGLKSETARPFTKDLTKPGRSQVFKGRTEAHRDPVAAGSATRRGWCLRGASLKATGSPKTSRADRCGAPFSRASERFGGRLEDLRTQSCKTHV